MISTITKVLLKKITFRKLDSAVSWKIVGILQWSSYRKLPMYFYWMEPNNLVK